MSKKLSSETPGVSHHLPHRTRLRVSKHKRKSRSLKQVQDKLAKVPGVSGVEVNERTGSILVHHEEDNNVLELLGTALEEVAGDLFETSLEVEEAEVPGLSIIAHAVKKQMGLLDTSVATATGNMIDLKTVVPLGLLAAALYKVAKERVWWGDVPAFVLFYYAYDSYMKFHGPSVRAVSASPRTEREDGRLENPVRAEMRRRGKELS